MDFFTYMLGLSFLVGAGFIIYSLINFHGPRPQSEAEPAAYARLEDKLEAFDATLSEADSTLAELDDKSKSVLRELDDKYKELLFLYNMIDDKKAMQTGGNPLPTAPAPRVDVVVDDRTKRRLQSPRLQKILELQASGLNVSEIAKKMGMGKGEVNLILELGKDVRRNA